MKYFIFLFLVLCCLKNAAAKTQPARVEILADSKIPKIIFTEEAEKRVAIETVSLRLQNQPARLQNSAVLYDNHGQAWIYLKLAPQTYQRISVEVKKVNAAEVWIQFKKNILPADSELIAVTVGAAELFGTESGVGK